MYYFLNIIIYMIHSIYSNYIWFTAILIICLCIIILIGNRNKSSVAFAILSLTTSIWVISQGFFISTTNYHIAEKLIRFQYILGILISIIIYNFSRIYHDNKTISQRNRIISVTTSLIFIILICFSNSIIIGVYKIDDIEGWEWKFGHLHLIYDITFYLLWSTAILNLFKKYKSSTGLAKNNLLNMLYVLTIGVIPTTTMAIFLPSVGYFKLNWISPISSIIWVIILLYAIIKYQQLNVKTIIPVLLTISITVLFFINILIKDDILV